MATWGVGSGNCVVDRHIHTHTHTEIQTNKALVKHKAINIKVNLSEGLNVYSSSNTERTRALLYALTLLLERVLDNRTRLCYTEGRERGRRQSQLTTSPTLTQCYCPRSRLSRLCHWVRAGAGCSLARVMDGRESRDLSPESQVLKWLLGRGGESVGQAEVNWNSYNIWACLPGKLSPARTPTLWPYFYCNSNRRNRKSTPNG